MKWNKVNNYLMELTKEYNIPSWQCRVIYQDQIVVDAKAHNFDESKSYYYIYSMTKMITCVAIMKLVEEGKLSLDDKVSRYLPAFEELMVRQGEKVVKAHNSLTVRNLISMQGGYDYDVEEKNLLEAIQKNSNASTRELINTFQKRTLMFEPGEGFAYSLCYDVLGAVIEVASGMRFGEYLTEKIFRPLGMDETTFKLTEEVRQKLVPLYQYNAQLKKTEEIVPAFNRLVFTPDYESGGAGLISTFEDYFKFVKALLNGKILKKESMNQIYQRCMSDEMLKKYHRYDQWGTGYSFGVRSQVDYSKAPALMSDENFELSGAAGSFAFWDLKNKMAFLYFQHTLDIVEVPEIVHHKIRDLIYEEMGEHIEALLTDPEKDWVHKIWTQLDQKLSIVAERSQEKLPFWSYDGKHDDWSEKNIHLWTNGFWPGLMWLMYAGTGKERYMEIARKGEEKLDKALDIPEKLGHDVGFMWKLAAGPDFELTGCMEARRRLRKAADHLAGRFNPMGGFIRAWNWGATPGEKAGWTIIDSMMNLPLLYWASRDTRDPRFQNVAICHLNKAMEYHVRPDGSVKHICVFDPLTGEYLREPGRPECQGMGEGSSWSRGQAWALYGFTLAYIHTEKQEYLDTAKKVAHYFIANVCDDWLTKCDFRSPKEPVYYDSSAGACAACGLIELARVVPEYEKELYLKPALHILRAMEVNFADWCENTDFIIDKSSGSYKSDHNLNIIYADYFFAEAVYKLKGFERLFW